MDNVLAKHAEALSHITNLNIAVTSVYNQVVEDVGWQSDAKRHLDEVEFHVSEAEDNLNQAWRVWLRHITGQETDPGIQWKEDNEH